MKAIKEIAEEFCRENKLDISYSPQMLPGFERQNSMYDPDRRMLFYNESQMQSMDDSEQLFHLYYELRRAWQYCRPEDFPPLLQRSLNYVLSYDGSAKKHVEGSWLYCQLEADPMYLTLASMSQPFEIDANSFAYDKAKEQCGETRELENIRSFRWPEHRLSQAELTDIYDRIDRKTNPEYWG